LIRAFLINIVGLLVVAVVLSSSACAENEQETAGQKDNRQEESGRIFDLKVPEGFELQPVEEPGILKWTKDSAEIYVVVGDVFAGSKDLLFNSLQTAAKKDKQLEKVQVIPLKGGKAMLLVEKAPSEPDRFRSWRLVSVTDNKVIHIDFTAPEKDFPAFEPGFRKALKSFKLKSAS
jgi:hypothetical protein